jgi:hypothetical protein
MVSPGRLPGRRKRAGGIEHHGDVLRPRQAVIAILDVADHRIVLGQKLEQTLRMLPRHVGIGLALNDAHRAVCVYGPGHDAVVAAILEQVPHEDVRLGPVWRRLGEIALLLQIPLLRAGQLGLMQLAGEVGRGRQQQQPCDRIADTAPVEFGDHAQRDPRAH